MTRTEFDVAKIIATAEDEFSMGEEIVALIESARFGARDDALAAICRWLKHTAKQPELADTLFQNGRAALDA